MAVVAAIPILAKFGSQIVSRIFGGMRLRAEQATNENVALQQIVEGFDQAIAQLQQQYNSGSLSQQDALSEVNSIWSWYWYSITPKIQPNRNGCASGTACPGHAIAYAGTNGVPAGYCSGNEGASCCVGCGPIRLSIENVVQALESGGGSAHIAAIGGDKYGLQTRLGYDVTFKAPVFSSITQEVNAVASQLTGGGLYDTSGSTFSHLTGAGGGSGILIVGILGIILIFAALLFSRR